MNGTERTHTKPACRKEHAMENALTLRLSRIDYDRISNLLGTIANLARRDLSGAPVEDIRAIVQQIITPVPPEEAHRLVDELERQATQGRG